MNSGLIAHLIELRKRCTYCAGSIIVLMMTSFAFYNHVYMLLSKPFESLNLNTHAFYINSVIEAVTIKLKFSLLFGLIFSIPVILYHALRFCIPALKKRETRLLIATLICSFILAIASFSYAYFILLPICLNFLMSHHFIPSDVGILLTYSNNLLFVFNFITYIILSFQLPLILLLLLYFNILNRKSLLKSSRYIIVIIVIISALVTPPDVISQLLLSLPLIILFFLVILLAKLLKLGNQNV